MNKIRQHLSAVFKDKKDIDTQVNTLINTKYRTLIKKKADELETKLLPKHEPSKKLIYQEEIAHMRKQLSKDKTTVNVTYAVNPPYAFVHILFNKELGEYSYHIKEPKLKADEQTTLDLIKKKLEETMDAEDLPVEEKSMFNRSKQLRTYLYNRFEHIIDLYDIQIQLKRKPVLFYFLESELLGLGRSDAVLKDPYVEDIGCNGPHVPLYLYHRVFGSLKTNVIYTNELELNKFIFKLAQISGKHISVYQPILDAVLADGSRINLTLGSEVTRKGSTFTIRKFSYDPISPIDLLRFGTISPFQLAYFWMLIEHKKSILMSGGTASGKTTMLNALCMFIRPEDKIVSIEDTPEIHIDHENWIQSVARKGYGKMAGLSGISAISGISGVGGMGGSPGDVDLFDLLVAALRQRPEYVIVGEIRGREAFTLFQAIAVGHSSMSTVHAGSIDELLHRTESQPMNIPRVLFSSIDTVAFVGQVNYQGKRVRRIKNIVEVLEIEPETCNLLTNKAFIWHPKNDFFHFNGRSFILEKIGQEIGKTTDAIMHEIHQKEQYIQLMDKKNITHFKDVSRAINNYYVDPVQAAMDLKKR
jgi:archaeal flagellar protein FlaI